MKLLIVTQYFHPENFRVNDIAEGLVERGHSVDVLTSLPNIPGGRFFDGYGWFSRGEKKWGEVNVERVGVIPRGDGSAVKLMLNCASYAINSLFHVPHLRRRGYDAVFVFNNSPITSIVPARAVARRRCPNVVFVLDIWPESMYFLLGMRDDAPDGLFKRISRAVSRSLYKSADTLLISSKGFEDKLRSMGLSQRIEYFPNYAEPLPAGEALAKDGLGFSNDDFVVGFAGNVGKAQGLDLLVKAASALKGQNDRIKYLIVGDGSELPSLKAAVEKGGLSDCFVFTGWVDSARVPSYIAACDAMLVSLKDSEVLNLAVPAKLQTYMYAAKPVVAFMNGAGAETVEQARCGVAAKAEDEGALSGAIKELSMLGAAELARLGENGKRYCSDHFNRETILDSLERYLEESIESYKR